MSSFCSASCTSRPATFTGTLSSHSQRIHSHHFWQPSLSLVVFGAAVCKSGKIMNLFVASLLVLFCVSDYTELCRGGGVEMKMFKSWTFITGDMHNI